MGTSSRHIDSKSAMMPVMEFQAVVRKRRMVRNYDPNRPVEPAVVDRMLDNALRAPSAGFSQGWAFLVLDRPTDVERFWSATTPSNPPSDSPPDPPNGPSADPPGGTDDWLAGMRTAPLVVIPLAHPQAYLDRYAEPDKGWTDRDESRWPVPYWHIDTGMAALLILQTAVDEGLGACFFGIPPDRTAAFRAAFGVPDAYLPIGAITVGHRVGDPGALGSPARRRRRTVDEVVHRGRW
jgi:nitroreductase